MTDDDNNVVPVHQRMRGITPAEQAMADDIMATVTRHEHLGHNTIVEALILELIFLRRQFSNQWDIARETPVS